MNRRTNERTNERMNKCTKEWVDRLIKKTNKYRTYSMNDKKKGEI